ncbi:MAG TPA: ABC transporter permease, partial [Nevskiaceae bacterium]|nr:ABC transporter permease [Nevskiaceae bacterium]
MASFAAQIAAVTAMNVKNVPSRWGASMVIVIGIAGVVGVLIALLSMARGFQATLASTGRADRAVLLRGGANDELSSVIMREQVDVVRQAPGVKKDAQGQPMALPEVYLLSGLPRRGGSEPSNVVVRGTEARVLEVRPEIRIVEGRMFTPGLREVVVGRGAQAQFANLNLGDHAAIRNGDWAVVGIFESGGDVHESEVLADLETLMSAAHRPVPTSMVVQLEDAAAFTRFKDALTADPRMSVKVLREPDYYSSRSEQLGAFINYLGYTVAVIMAIGALFGAL